MHFILVLGDIKIYIKISPTCFGLRLSSGGLHMSLAKVTFLKSVKVRRYGLCGCVAACCHTNIAAPVQANSLHFLIQLLIFCLFARYDVRGLEL